MGECGTFWYRCLGRAGAALFGRVGSLVRVLRSCRRRADGYISRKQSASFFIFHVAYLGNSCPIHVPQPSRQLLLRFPLRLQMLLQPSLSPHCVTLLLVGPRAKGVLGRDDEFGRGERADKDDAAVRF